MGFQYDFVLAAGFATPHTFARKGAEVENMGYCMSQNGCKFHISSENVEKVREALIPHMNEWSGYGRHSTKNYATMEIDQIFSELRWDIEVDQRGNIVRILFVGEKLWEDEEMLRVIAPWVESGSFIEMDGEDGSKWRWVFKDGSFCEIHPQITWPVV